MASTSVSPPPRIFGYVAGKALPALPLLPPMPRQGSKHLLEFRVDGSPRVIDGDTVDAWLDLESMGKLSGFEKWRVNIRLWGISAAEKDAKDPEQRAQAASAAIRLAQLVQQTPLTAVLLAGSTLGRALGLLFDSSGQCLNELLVAEGHAKPFLPTR